MTVRSLIRTRRMVRSTTAAVEKVPPPHPAAAAQSSPPSLPSAAPCSPVHDSSFELEPTTTSSLAHGSPHGLIRRFRPSKQAGQQGSSSDTDHHKTRTRQEESLEEPMAPSRNKHPANHHAHSSRRSVRFNLRAVQYHKDLLRNLNSLQECHECWYDKTTLQEFRAEQLALTQHIFEDTYRLPPEQAEAAQDCKGTLTQAFEACTTGCTSSTTTSTSLHAPQSVSQSPLPTEQQQQQPRDPSSHSVSSSSSTVTEQPLSLHSNPTKKPPPWPNDSNPNNNNNNNNNNMVQNPLVMVGTDPLEQLYRRASDLLVGLETNILTRLRGKVTLQNKVILRQLAAQQPPPNGSTTTHSLESKDHANDEATTLAAATATTESTTSFSSSSSSSFLCEQDVCREIASLTQPSVRFAHRVAVAQAKALDAAEAAEAANAVALSTIGKEQQRILVHI